MKMQEIRVMAKKLGVNSFGKTKVQLIKEIQKAEGNFDCFGTAKGFCDQMDCCFRDLCLNPGSAKKRARKSRKTRRGSKNTVTAKTS